MMEPGYYWAKRKHSEEWQGPRKWQPAHYVNDRMVLIYGEWLMHDDFDFGPKLEPPEE